MYQLCEVINSYNEELDLPFAKSKQSQDINSPLCEWPRGEYGVQLQLFLVNEIAMFLTWYTFLDEGMTIYFHGWPKVVDFEYSGHHGL